MRWRTCSIRSGPRPSLASQAWPHNRHFRTSRRDPRFDAAIFRARSDFGVAIALVYPGLSDGNNPPGGLLEPVLTSRMVANGPLTPTDGRGMSSVLLNQISTFESLKCRVRRSHNAYAPPRPLASACEQCDRLFFHQNGAEHDD